MNDDLHQLKLLSIFYYIVGSLMGLLACIPILHVVVGILLVTGFFDQPAGKGEAPPAALGWIFIAFGSFIILLGWAFAIALFVAGRRLREQRNYLFCLIMAGLATTIQPFGVVLGIFSIIVLLRPSVKELFSRDKAAPAGGEFQTP